MYLVFYYDHQSAAWLRRTKLVLIPSKTSRKFVIGAKRLIKFCSRLKFRKLNRSIHRVSISEVCLKMNYQEEENCEENFYICNLERSISIEDQQKWSKEEKFKEHILPHCKFQRTKQQAFERNTNRSLYPVYVFHNEGNFGRIQRCLI